MRGATYISLVDDYRLLISIHAPHAGSDVKKRGFYPMQRISIHAPHAGSDAPVTMKELKQLVISIHAPHAGSDSGLYPESMA